MAITGLFFTYNLYFLLVTIGVLDDSISEWVFGVNSISIGLYLFFLISEEFIGRRSLLGNTPMLFFSLAIGFGVNGILQSFDLEDIATTVEISLPLLIGLSILITLFSLSKHYFKLPLLWASMTFVFITIIVSYSTYFENSQMSFVLALNLFFLLFASLQYFKLYLVQKIKPLPKIEEVDPLDKFGLTKHQKEITLMILTGKTYHEIAQERHVAYTTITSHAAKIFVKVGVHSQDELIINLRNELDIKQLIR